MSVYLVNERWVIGDVSWMRPCDVNPKPSAYTRALLDVRTWQAQGTLETQAVEAVSLNYEREDYDELRSEVESLKDERDEQETACIAAENERDDLQRRIDEMAVEDTKVAEWQKATKEAKDARSDARHAAEMTERAEKQASENYQKLSQLREAMRAIVGDSPDALALVAYWHGEARANTVELIALRKRVAELEAPSAKRTAKQLREDLEYWKAKAMGSGK